mgnify:CR=1 FL=1|tara:strand:+ start:792 stop:1034 length:243 start_codon:yes stop_codon:yes gene_type:complete
MKKPIFRVLIDYTIKNKRQVRGKMNSIDTFVLTDNINEIKKDKELINRICYLNKKNPLDVVIDFNNIEVENQYGETTDRF